MQSNASHFTFTKNEIWLISRVRLATLTKPLRSKEQEKDLETVTGSVSLGTEKTLSLLAFKWESLVQ